MGDEPTVIQTTAPTGARVVLLSRVWDEKIVKDHPELDTHMPAVLTLGVSARVADCWLS